MEVHVKQHGQGLRWSEIRNRQRLKEGQNTSGKTIQSHGNRRSRVLNSRFTLRLENQWWIKMNRVPNFKELTVKWKPKNPNQINHTQNVLLQPWCLWSVRTIEMFGCIWGGGGGGGWRMIQVCFSQRELEYPPDCYVGANGRIPEQSAESAPKEWALPGGKGQQMAEDP